MWELLEGLGSTQEAVCSQPGEREENRVSRKSQSPQGTQEDSEADRQVLRSNNEQMLQESGSQ
jgi:hypothetical protein